MSIPTTCRLVDFFPKRIENMFDVARQRRPDARWAKKTTMGLMRNDSSAPGPFFRQNKETRIAMSETSLFWRFTASKKKLIQQDQVFAPPLFSFSWVKEIRQNFHVFQKYGGSTLHVVSQLSHLLLCPESRNSMATSSRLWSENLLRS